MKKLLLLAALLLPLLSHSQQGDYSKKWKIIDSLEVRGLVNSANSHVNEILASAQKRKEHLQFIRAKIYHYKFYQINNENSNHYILDDVNTTLAKLPAPSTNIS